MTFDELPSLSTRQLLVLSRQVLMELRNREELGLRTWNSPVGEVAELLVAKAFGGTGATNASEKDWDVKLGDGRKVQVKALMQNGSTKLRNFSPIRCELDDLHDCIFVVFDGASFEVAWARDVPREQLRACLRSNKRVNGRVAHAAEVRNLGHEVSAELQTAWNAL